MKLIDITRNLTEAPIYPGSSPVVIQKVLDMGKGDPFNASMVTSGSHMGTHADAYCHFLGDSEVTVDQMELSRYYGPCRVVTVEQNALIPASAFEGQLEGCRRLVIHGGGLSYLTAEAASYLVAQGIRTIVTDAWSIAPLDNEAEIHQIILGAGMAVVENVILDGVEDGDYLLCAFPVKMACDGAPVRAVLIRE